MRQLIIIIFFLTGFFYCQAQESKCLADFDYIVNRIKNDYPGYLDKVNEDNIKDLESLENEIKKKITQYPDSCFKYLNDYTAWFKDHHLRVSCNRSSSKKDRKESYDKKYAEFNSDSLTKQIKTLEGIWIGFNGNFAILKQNNKYLGIAIKFSGYDKNQIIFEAIEKENNEYELTMFSNSQQFQQQKGKASLLSNNSVFEIHDDTRFVRQTSDKKADMAFLYSYIPKYPNGLNIFPLAMYLDDSTFYLRVPDFYSSTANDLVEKHWDEITTRPNLIIDIRNNGGGQDNYYQKLAELIYTNSYDSKGVEWYSTKEIIADWKNLIKNGGIKEGSEEDSKVLVEEMKTNIGGFVVHQAYGGDGIVEKDTIYTYPKKIGIIINGRNASSAEQFLLEAKHSSKVVIFGNENTAGVLDYSNITPKKLPSGEYNLWLPATRSRRLPDNPIDNIGIAPDVYIPLEPTLQLFNRLDDWVYFVMNYLEYK
jgi:hypothetical protein